MRKLCSISGMTITTPSHFSNYFTRHVHPIMEVKTSALIELLGTKSFLEWQDEEAKLLFLALANSLEMLAIVSPAIPNPSQATIASSIENLVAIAGWHTTRNFPLPQLRIVAASNSADTSSNERMLEFPALLTSIIASRAQTRQDDADELAIVHLEEVIKILYSKCSIGANKTKMLRSKVADWALRITAAEARHERIDNATLLAWHTMLTTAPIDAWKFQTLSNGEACNVDIMELDEFMSDHLPHGCTASYEVMEHLRSMKTATVGLADALGITIITQAAAFNTEAEPLASDFPTKLEYLIAKAKYRMAIAATPVIATDTRISRIEEVPEEELALDEEVIDDSDVPYDEATDPNLQEGENDDYGI